MANHRPTIVMYTDGSCDNRGNGAWAASLRCKDDRTTRYFGGNAKNATSNRMELLAVVSALAEITCDSIVELWSDSKYVLRGITLVEMWSKYHWKTKQGVRVAHRDLWMKILEFKQHHRIRLHWVKGHAGHMRNEQVDSLAQTIRRRHHYYRNLRRHTKSSDSKLL